MEHSLLSSISTYSIMCASIFIVFLLFYYSTKKMKKAIMEKPKLALGGPPSLPIIGNLHQLSKLSHVSLAKLAEKYGGIMKVRMGMIPCVVVSSSEATKLFLKTNDGLLASRPLNPVLGGVIFNADGLPLAPYGDWWRHFRKTSVLHLFTNKKLQSLAYIRKEEVTNMLKSLWDESNEGNDPVDVSNAFTTLTCNVALRVLVGRSYTRERSIKLKMLLREVNFLVARFNAGDIFPFLGFLDIGGVVRDTNNVKRRIFTILENIIADHEARKGHAVADIVDALLEDKTFTISKGHIKNLVMDLYIAAADTTSTVFTWAMAELMRKPHVLENLNKEIKSIVGEDGQLNEESLTKAKYLDCVIKETLRLHPSAATGIPHESLDDITVMGYHIPRKTRVLFNLWAIGRDPKVWSQPSEFIPERFIKDKSVDITGMGDFNMLPFGAGRRGCPGYVMALPLIKLALAQIIWNFTWVVEGGHSSVDMEEMPGITVGKKTPLYLLPKLNSN